MFWADLDPARGREQTGRRPVLVISHDIFNERSGTAIAMAITSQPQTAGSASLMSLRILPRVSPRQSLSSAILFEMSSDADWPWLAPDFFIFSSWGLGGQPARWHFGNEGYHLPKLGG